MVADSKVAVGPSRLLRVSFVLVVLALSGGIDGRVSAQELCAPEEPAVDRVVAVPGVPQWFFKPLPDCSAAFYARQGSGNQLLNLENGRAVRTPGLNDSVPTPDGRFFVVPNGNGGPNGQDFYRAEDLTSANPRSATPALRDGTLKGAYQSTAVLPSRDGETTYRVITTPRLRLGIRGTYRDYRLGNDAQGRSTLTPVGPAKEYCKNLKRAQELDQPRSTGRVDNETAGFRTPMLSSTGRYLAVYNVGSRTTQIWELGADDPSTCRLALDLGYATGKVSFNMDDSQIAFHTDQFHSENGGHFASGVAANMTKDTFVASLGAVPGVDGAPATLEISDITRLTTTLELGSGTYFPAFCADGRVAMLRERGNQYSMVVADPKKSRWLPYRTTTLAGDCPDDPATLRDGRAALGSAWMEACAAIKLTSQPEAILFTIGMDQARCEQLATGMEKSADAGTLASVRAVCPLLGTQSGTGPAVVGGGAPAQKVTGEDLVGARCLACHEDGAPFADEGMVLLAIDLVETDQMPPVEKLQGANKELVLEYLRSLVDGGTR